MDIEDNYHLLLFMDQQVRFDKKYTEMVRHMKGNILNINNDEFHWAVLGFHDDKFWYWPTDTICDKKAHNELYEQLPEKFKGDYLEIVNVTNVPTLLGYFYAIGSFDYIITTNFTDDVLISMGIKQINESAQV